MTRTNRFKLTTVLTSAMLAFSTSSQGADLPTGGQIIAGTGDIAQSGNAMTITQTTHNMAIDWQSFSIGAGHSVNFVQPSSSSVALNRVLGSDVSVIRGTLTANGQIFLINPNGVLFGSGAQVNVGGLVAATQSLRTEDFLSGTYRFDGTSPNAIINQGSIRAADGGTIALIAARIVNEGTVVAHAGNVLMGAGNTVTLDFGGPVKLEVEAGAIETLIEQKGAVRADGGRIYLTAKAAGTLASSVINHSGISEARTLSTGEKGEIVLLGDMTHGTTKIAGTLDASAPNGGDGGFIETSAANVDIAANTTITAGAGYGKGGLWLIDPFDYTIDATAAGNIANTLNTGTDVTVTTTTDNVNFGSEGSGVNGDITVSSAIDKTAGGEATLTLEAAASIVLNAEIKSTADKLNIILDADNDNGTRNGGGVIMATKGITTNGGSLDFGTGATLNIGGVNTLVGGDLYIGGTDKVVFSTGGGAINLQGELIIANTEGVNFTTSGGNARFYGIINSGNSYERISPSGGASYWTWQQAFDDAKNGTAGGGSVGDSYLATVTSRLENSVIVYTGDFPAPTGNNITDLSNGAWLAGGRTNGVWSWRAGPEGEENSGAGLTLMDNNVAVSGVFNNWRGGEPNGGTGGGGEDRLQIGDATGRWNDLVNDDGNVHVRWYIRETNLATANLEIDAGTGTATFDQDIGGLKTINYKSYDTSNPKPAATTSVTTTETSIPQNSAVAIAQSATFTAPAPINPNTFSSPTFGGPTTGPAGSPGGRLMVGSMDVVQVRSADLAPAPPGESEPSNGAGEGEGQNRDSSLPEITRLAGQGGLLGPTRVFVVDGGVRLPASGAEQD
jgi:filamentous hemagglutinin family protein